MWAPSMTAGCWRTVAPPSLLRGSRLCALQAKATRCRHMSQLVRRSGACRQRGRPARAESSSDSPSKEERQLVSAATFPCWLLVGCPRVGLNLGGLPP